MKISLQNFQSIRRADIEVRGLTVLTGTNNIGKTAVFRAVRSLLFNTGKQGFVRAGSKGFVVSVDDEIAYGRDKQNFYEVLGTRFDKVGRNPVSMLLDDFKKVPGFKGMGFLFLEDDGEVTTPQFTFQKETPFPFNLSSGKMYNVFSSFFGTEGIDTLVSEETQKVRESRARIAVLDAQEEQIQKATKSKTAVTKSLPPTQGIMDLRNRLAAKLETLGAAQDLLRNYQRVSKEILGAQVLADLEFPDVAALEDLVEALRRRREVLRSSDDAEAQLARIRGVLRAPDVDMKSVETLYDAHSRARKALGAFKSVGASVSTLSRTKALKIPDFEAIEARREIYGRARETLANYRRAEAEEKSAAALALGLEKSIIDTEDKLKTFDTCPLCGSALK